MLPGWWVDQVRASLTVHLPQVKTEISVESKHQTLQGLAFPLQPEAQRALQQLKQKSVNYIQMVGVLPAPHPQGRVVLLPAHAHPPTCSLQLTCVLVGTYCPSCPRPISGAAALYRECTLLSCPALFTGRAPYDTVPHSALHTAYTYPWVHTAPQP